MQSTADNSGVVAALLAQHHEPGTVIRIARTALGWSQAELGRRCGYSASQVSRWETGRVPLRDVTLLRTLAGVLALPLEVFGLLTNAPTRSIRPSSRMVTRIPGPRCEEDERVRRRRFLLATGLTSSSSLSVLADEVDPAALLAHQLGSVLLGPDTSAEPVAALVLSEALTAAQRDFSACRYIPLALHPTGRPAADRRLDHHRRTPRHR